MVWEDPLEKDITHPDILAWRIPGAEEPGGRSLWGHKESVTTEVTQRAKKRSTLKELSSEVIDILKSGISETIQLSTTWLNINCVHMS